MSIPASAIVNVLPGVISTGGSGLDLIGLFLTDNARVPIGAVRSFTTAADVSAFFGPLATETTIATVYFAGYDRSPIKPGAILFMQYATSAVGAYLRGGNLSALTLTQLQAFNGVLTITVDGTAKTSGTINLATATSFSNAAAIIQSAFTNPGFTVSYDTVSGGFVFANTDTGATSTIGYATGTLAPSLLLRAADGAYTSQGAAAYTPGAAMDQAVGLTQDFVSFATTFKPSQADMVAFSAWTHAQNRRYLYAMWDNAVSPTTNGDTSSAGYQVAQANYDGTVPIYDPNSGVRVAAFLMGAIASIDFTRANGRVTAKFLSNALVPAGVTNQTIANNLIANGYNFYGSYATANQPFVFFSEGTISGVFDFIDSYVNEVWMNAAFQLSLMNLMTTSGSIPYNQDGYARIEAALQGAIDDAVSFGAIRGGVSLTDAQVAQVNAAAGRDIATTIETRGWYALCLPASGAVRAARGSPPVYFFYTDGQSVHRLTLNSVLVQ